MEIRNRILTLWQAILIFLLVSSLALAGHPINILDAFSEQKVIISFEASPDNQKEKLNLRILNASDSPIKIIIQGTITFDVGMAGIKVVVHIMPGKIIDLDPGKSEILSVQQTGSERIVDGKLTIKKTQKGTEFNFENLVRTQK